MNVKQAVKTAMEHVADVYSEENISHIGLEEVEYDEPTAQWNVTVGFARKWDIPHPAHIPAFVPLRPNNRTYKIVVIRDSDGQVTAMKIRELAAS
ncbi:MAG: hypothetical protein OXG98_03095 [Gemmatimonadetes bacterium]|nr:hypothetical protein [Gemmatimonadota bacterium]